MKSEDIWWQLKQPFFKYLVKWRIGPRTRDKSRGQPLCYVDARIVMQRLDDVVGPENWQDSYSESTKRVICSLSLRVGDEWITKSDGAGDTDMEGEKGGLSDAFKRAAVKFGVGRYLYGIHSPWVNLNDKGKLPDTFDGREYLPDPSPFTSKQMRTKVYNALRDAAFDDNAHRLKECWDELENEEKMDIWRDLSSSVRGRIKKMQESKDDG